ncbi:hypothetical protein KC726_05635 [Candidatus Woesebacteria bacterium]|nr:hypothetical protein [Candidatus Woesebacteria bacterium]
MDNNDKNNQKTLAIPGPIKLFLESLIDDAGVDIVDAVMKEEMVKELFARLDSYIATQIVAALPDDKLEGFMDLNKKQATQQEIEQYLKDNISNYSEVITNTMIDFRDIYLGNVGVYKDHNNEKSKKSFETKDVLPPTAPSPAPVN